MEEREIPIAKSRNYERLSIQAGNEYIGKNSKEIKEYLFDGKRYIPSKEFVRNKKSYVMQEEIFNIRKSKRKYLTANKETIYRAGILIDKIQEEAYREKR